MLEAQVEEPDAKARRENRYDVGRKTPAESERSWIETAVGRTFATGEGEGQ